MFVVEDRGPQTLKGVREPVTLYRVVQPSGVRSRLDVAAGRLTRFVGRDMELGDARSIAGSGRRTARGRTSSSSAKRESASRASSTSCTSTWRRCPTRGSNAARRRTRKGHPSIRSSRWCRRGWRSPPEDTAAEKLGKLEVGLARARLSGDRGPARRLSRSAAAHAAAAEPRAAAAQDDRPAGAVEPRAERSAAAGRCSSRTCTGATSRRWSCWGT